PNQASGPSPGDTATDIIITSTLSWTAGADTISHDVYLGTSFNDVNNASQPAGDTDGDGLVDWDDIQVLSEQWLSNPECLYPHADLNGDNDVNFVDLAIIADDWTEDVSAVFMGNQMETVFDPGILNYETTYYWRIDQVNSFGKTKGNIWSFTTAEDTGIDPSLVGWWEFENDANDSAGNNDGTVYGAVYTGGKIGQALSFDEIDDYVLVPDFDYTNASNEFSLSFWFKIDDVAGSAYQYMFSHGNVNANNSLNVYFSETDEGTGGEEVRTKIVLGDSTSWYGVTSGIFADGAWHLYTITVSSIDGAKIYIDENPLLTNPAVKDASLNPATDIFLGGRCDLNADRYYGNPSIDDGLIDDVRLYNRVLSPSEVAILAAGGGL
ncbi:MAG: LamG-like jellyroll fold domain-containing protein, partial [Planctomycetota bacterium]